MYLERVRVCLNSSDANVGFGSQAVVRHSNSQTAGSGQKQPSSAEKPANKQAPQGQCNQYVPGKKELVPLIGHRDANGSQYGIVKNKRKVYFRLKELITHSGLRNIENNEYDKRTKEPLAISLEEFFIGSLSLNVGWIEDNGEHVEGNPPADQQQINVETPSRVICPKKQHPPIE